MYTFVDSYRFGNLQLCRQLTGMVDYTSVDRPTGLGVYTSVHSYRCESVRTSLKVRRWQRELWYLNYTSNYATSHPVDCIFNCLRSRDLNCVGEYLDQQRRSLTGPVTSYSLVDVSELCDVTPQNERRQARKAVCLTFYTAVEREQVQPIRTRLLVKCEQWTRHNTVSFSGPLCAWGLSR